MAGQQAEDEERAVPESEGGTWVHAGYHLTCATAGPPLLSLPYVMRGVGWAGGLAALVAGALLSLYACVLLSRVMEHLEHTLGKRSLRYRDLAAHVVGSKLSKNMIAPLQFMVCFLAIIAGTLLGGETMKQIFLVSFNGVHLELYIYIIIFGTLTLFLAQLPSLHSLRHFNLISLLLCVGFSICAVVGSIYAGLSNHAPPKDYSIVGSPINKMCAVFNSISIMISAYANPVIVEIQATLASPTKGKMVKGLGMCYSVALTTFFSVAISGYWAFGNQSMGIVFSNMVADGRVILVPKALYVMGNACACVQLVIITVLYLQPTFEKYEEMMADTKKGRCAGRNLLPRVVGRSIFVVSATLFAAMLPFFAEFSAFLGSFGFTPICIIFPLLFYNRVFQRTALLRLNHAIIAAASLLVLVGSFASFRQILLNAKTYRLFANL